ncbi:unnamed protein product [Bursaphelenchus okinawaensis]|uniref:Uncharacterized protein n=1 Tax=Bursaphelenchus okinawaensis TaxID=465554 RepID=A0A811LBQ9_9BILA|nr:unnamed protein product [Bursaphelenchus okinawaensis]CAG9120373.1 unnamed protein product [Bursaphelenchus okinawaensis]
MKPPPSATLQQGAYKRRPEPNRRVFIRDHDRQTSEWPEGGGRQSEAVGRVWGRLLHHHHADDSVGHPDDLRSDAAHGGVDAARGRVLQGKVAQLVR